MVLPDNNVLDNYYFACTHLCPITQNDKYTNHLIFLFAAAILAHPTPGDI